MGIPMALLTELTRKRLVDELEEIEELCSEVMRGGPAEPVQQRVRELKLTVERFGITEA